MALARWKTFWFGLLWIGAAGAMAAPELNIVTGPERATNVQIGNDLAKYVAAPVHIDMQVLTSNGAVDNIRRLRDEPGTRLGIVQSDVYQALKGQALRGNAEAARVISPLRVLLPLYESEFHFMVRADSPLQSIHQIQDQRINVGPMGSGSAMSTTTLYRLMFGTDLPVQNISTYTHEEAMLKLVKDKTVDVVVVVSGQPVPLFLGMEPGVEKYFKFLALDDRHLTYPLVASTYGKAPIRNSSYPNWVSQDVPSLSVKNFLVTYDHDLANTRQALVSLTKSLCENLPTLQKEGHTKWRQTALQLPELSEGWRYYAPTKQAIERCPKFKAKPVRLCSLQEKVSGLCTEF